ARLSHKSFAEMSQESERNFEDHSRHKDSFKKQAVSITEHIVSEEFDAPLPYLMEVKVNKRGKKHQEKQADKRHEQIRSNRHAVKIDNDDDDTDFDASEAVLRNM
ncbi:MAG: hypothetical protein PHQ74_15085, partial [Crocinitomicaceae bacterium]|nr:hypothetical protein [Crocinitomicaceae bacterium]